MQRRKICSLLQVTGAANVMLHSPEGQDVAVALSLGQILVFRHDRFSFTYEGCYLFSSSLSLIRSMSIHCIYIYISFYINLLLLVVFL